MIRPGNAGGLPLFSIALSTAPRSLAVCRKCGLDGGASALGLSFTCVHSSQSGEGPKTWAPQGSGFGAGLGLDCCLIRSTVQRKMNAAHFCPLPKSPGERHPPLCLPETHEKGPAPKPSCRSAGAFWDLEDLKQVPGIWEAETPPSLPLLPLPSPCLEQGCFPSLTALRLQPGSTSCPAPSLPLLQSQPERLPHGLRIVQNVVSTQSHQPLKLLRLIGEVQHAIWSVCPIDHKVPVGLLLGCLSLHTYGWEVAKRPGWGILWLGAASPEAPTPCPGTSGWAHISAPSTIRRNWAGVDAEARKQRAAVSSSGPPGVMPSRKTPLRAAPHHHRWAV